ncbi:MAG: amidase [Myxococcota bacterium]
MTARLYAAQRYTNAFRSGRLDPIRVSERCLDAIQDAENHDPSLRLFISYSGPDVQKQAEASAQRWLRGQELGPLDGVPVAIKDGFDAAGHRTTVGTALLGRQASNVDSTVVARLRRAGALILGKTNMHEVALGATGINPHAGTARNPHDLERICGGSSSGNAGAIAAGICPLAVGTDTGGSIRIPASLCGVVGLKPSYGRISTAGLMPLAWSLDHAGPMGTTVADVALLYGALAGPDDADPTTGGLPSPLLSFDPTQPVEGVRVGVDETWVRQAHDDVQRSFNTTLAALKEQGAVIQPVDIPERNHLRALGLITMLAEGATAYQEHLDASADVLGPDVRLGLEAGARLTAVQYLKAQRLRRALQEAMAELLGRVDVILTPATACTAPRIQPDALASGEVDDVVTTALTRYAFLANLTGLPALSVPGAPNDAGLPVGVQVLGRAYDEAMVLRVGAAVERASQPLQKPARVGFDVLQ